MSPLWNLLPFIATILLRNVCKSQGISASCRDSVEVVSGANVTVTCTVDFSSVSENCEIEDHIWSKNTDGIICNSSMMKDIQRHAKENADTPRYSCGSDGTSGTSGTSGTVHLSISSISKNQEGNYNVLVLTDCGKTGVRPFTLHVISHGGLEENKATTALLGTSVIVIIVVVSAVFMICYSKKRRTQRRRSNTDPEHGEEASQSLTNS